MTFRRHISRALARAAFHVDPDPPLTFTTTRRVDDCYYTQADHYDVLAQAISDVVSGKIGGRVGSGFRPDDPGSAARY